MSSTVLLVGAMVVLTVVAIAAAAAAFLALREVKALRAAGQNAAAQATPVPAPATSPAPVVRAEPAPVRELPHRVVEGRVIVTPTQEQAVAAVMTQPRYRAAIWLSGLAHALRPESRDRISAMMRREFRARRRERLRVARAAARRHVPETRA